jgi:type IV secretion system protein VirB6
VLAIAHVGSGCVAANNFGQIISKEVAVDSANPKWVDSGIYLKKGQNFSVRAYGTVFLKKSSYEVTYPAISIKYDTGITIASGDFVIIDYLSGWIKLAYGSNLPNCADGASLSNCLGINGMAINFSIGSNASLNDSRYYLGLSQAKAGRTGSLFTKNLGGFYDYGMYFASNQSGNLLIKSIDNAGNFLNNTGSYNFNVTLLKQPVDISTISAAASGALQFVISKEDLSDNTNNTNLSPAYVNKGVYTGSAASEGKLWLQVYENTINGAPSDSQYTDNAGSYNVHITTNNQVSGLSNFIQSIISPIENQTRIAAQLIYQNLAGDSKFHKIGTLLVNLYIIIYAIFFIFGLVQINQSDLVMRLFKIGIIFNLINSDYSWTFFNQYLFSLFQEGSKQLIQIFTTTYQLQDQPTDTMWGFVDQTIGQFFTKTTIAKISALLFSVPGFVLGMIIIYSMMVYMRVIGSAVVTFVFSIIGISLLIAVAPLFLMSILFEKTKSLFDNWIRFIFNFALQPVILLALIIFINRLVIIMFYKLMSFEACWSCAVPIFINLGDWQWGSDSDPLFCINYFLPRASTGYFWANIFGSTIVFLLLTKLMAQMADFAPQIVDFLTGSRAASVRLSGGYSITNQAISQVKNTALGAVGLDDASKARRKGNG